MTASETATALSWLVSCSSSPPAMPQNLQWAVLQATDAFIWGVFDGEVWRWATEQADKNTAPCHDTLLEMRAFGPEGELLIWRTETGFAGRILKDAASEVRHTACVPLDRRTYFLPTPDATGQIVGSVRPTQDPAFLRRQSGDGRTTVTPIGSGVLLRNYLESCPETGVMRIAATRFVTLF